MPSRKKRTKEETILAHIARYRLSTPDIIQRLYYPTAKSDGGAKSVIKRLRASGYVDSAKLYAEGKEVYYHLTPKGAVHLGEAETYGGPVRNLARRYAWLLFCCARRPRPRFTKDEFNAAFPGMLEGDFLQHFTRSAYYLDIDDGTRRLGRVLESLGKFSPRIAREAVQNAKVQFPDLVRDNRFALAFVTAASRRAQEIRDFHSEEPIGGEPRLHLVVETFDELLPIVELNVEKREAEKRAAQKAREEASPDA